MLRIDCRLHRVRISIIAIFTLGVVFLSGCGPDRPEMVPVSGKVTVDGGPPPGAGGIYFAPLEVAEGTPRRPGVAEFDASGNFEVTSFADSDGLVPGIYRVRVECWKVPRTMDLPGESYIVEDASLPDLFVAADAGSITHNIDVPAKPASN